jgi:hypothetical protein
LIESGVIGVPNMVSSLQVSLTPATNASASIRHRRPDLFRDGEVDIGLGGMGLQPVQVNFKARDDSAVSIDVIAVPDPETVIDRVHLELATTSAAHQAESGLTP